jgi:ATP-dependent DNA ligase
VVFAKAGELGLEGIVSKRASSFYKSGRRRSWLKTRESKFRQDVTSCLVRRKAATVLFPS